MEQQWLSIVEYARARNVSDMTVRRRIRSGKLQAVLREGKYFIPVDNLEENPTVRSTAQVPEHFGQIPQPKPSHANDLRQAMPERQNRPTDVHFKPDTAGDFDHKWREMFRKLDAMGQRIDHGASLAAETYRKKMHDSLEKNYRLTIAHLEERLQNKELQIESLRQQIEDMQVLVKILENNN